MSDLLRTQLQETGRMGAYGKTLAQVISIVTDLGIDPHDVRVRMSGYLVVEPVSPVVNKGLFNDQEPDDLSDHPDHPDNNSEREWCDGKDGPLPCSLTKGHDPPCYFYRP